jgi:hypothetical protein
MPSVLFLRPADCNVQCSHTPCFAGIETQNRTGRTQSPLIIGISASVESLGQSSVGLPSGVWTGSFDDRRWYLGMVGINQDLEGIMTVFVHLM